MTIDAPRINGNGRHSIGSQSPIDGVLARLEGVRKSGGGFMARCPAHEDRTASLSVSAGNDGRVLLKCHAGCANPHIVAKIGLKLADLFPPRADGASFRPNSKPARKPLGRVVAIYDYRDADGVLVCQKIRHQDHEFRQRRPDGNGGWISNLDGVTKPLYRLPELLNAREDQPDAWIFICEGEKDADRCASEGLIATTNIGGAGNKWSDAYSDTLQGAPVVILVDNDDAGRKDAEAKAKSLLGKAADIRIIELPGLPPKGDVSDFLDAGGTVEQILEIVEKTAPYIGQDVAKIAPEANPKTFREHAKLFPELRPPIIEGLLRRGETMNLVAPSKTGKTWMVSALALSGATGRSWLDQFHTKPGNVLVIDNELHGETSANRIPKVASAMGITFEQYADRLYVENLRGKLKDIISLESYFASLEPGRFQMIILDAFYRFMPAGTDENDNGALANIYNILDRYADRLGCCFVLIHHSSKGIQAGKSVVDVGAGAGSQSRATDTHLILRQHEEDGVVVLDACVRSWPPINPICLRWEFPIWTVDNDLDPTQLRIENRRKKHKEEISDVPAESKIVWTAEKFTDSFITDEPVEKRIIIARASIVMPVRQAERWLTLAEHERRIHLWTSSDRKKPVRFSTVQQPVTETA
jgi:hypothetical protein